MDPQFLSGAMWLTPMWPRWRSGSMASESFVSDYSLEQGRKDGIMDPHNGLTFGIAIGAGVGTVVGVIIGNIALVIALGVGVGVALGTAFDYSHHHR